MKQFTPLQHFIFRASFTLTVICAVAVVFGQQSTLTNIGIGIGCAVLYELVRDVE